MTQDNNFRQQMTAVFIITFLNMVGFGIVIPMLPYFAAEFGAGPQTVGLLISSYAAAQFIGAPFWGRLSDRYGRRFVLLWTVFVAAIGYVLFGFSNSVFMLFFSRILTGLMNGNISVIQAYITDVTNPSQRAKGYGILGAAFGLGLVTGPALGGLLSEFSYVVAGLGAAGLNLFSLILIWLLLHQPGRKGARALSTATSFSLRALSEALKRPAVGPLLITRFYFSIAFSIFTTVFVLFADYAMHLSAHETAWLLTYTGILIVIVQGGLVGRVSASFGEGRLLFASLVLMAVTLVIWAMVRSVTGVVLMLIPFALAGGFFNTLINSSISKIVDDGEVGGILGISAAVESFTRILAPAIGGYLLAGLGAWAPGLIGAALLLLCLPYAYKHLIKKPHRILTE